MLTDEVACLVAPEADAMARGLIDLLRDGERRARLAAAAQDLAAREFTPRAFTAKVLRFYASVADRIGGGWDHGQVLEAGRPGAL